MKVWRVHISIYLLTVVALHSGGIEQGSRILILPFENPRNDSSLEYLREALPGLLASAVSRTEVQVVDRRHLNQVLSELSLKLEGLTSRDSRQRIGRLVGADVLISGSFVSREPGLVIAMRATDIATGAVTATAEVSGPKSQVARLVRTLYSDLARTLGRPLPGLEAEDGDTTPLSNLHFMRGLGYFYSARYNQALVEFMQAGAEKQLSEVSRWWVAHTYLEQQEYGHAYLELLRLVDGGPTAFSEEEIEYKIRHCERHLDPDEIGMTRRLALPKTPAQR